MDTSENIDTGKAFWLCLHFPKLPVEIFSRTRESHEPATPVVVLERQRVAFLSQAASDLGIRPGSNLNTAYTISESVTSFERDETKEEKALAQLAQWAYRFTPSVAVCPPHSLLLEISGCLKLFQGLAGLKAEVSRSIEQLGFTMVTGLNGTPLSALCYAEAGFGDNTGDVRRSLATVPVNCLRIEKDTLESLHRMGISSCGQLLELPADGLNRRFGVSFTSYLARLTGEQADPQVYISDRPRFSSEITFLSDVTELSSIAFPLKRLLGELHEFLKGRQLLVNQFTVSLKHRSHPTRQLNIQLANPDNDTAMFLMLSQLKLDQIDDMPEVDSISLDARQFFETEAPSGDLFHGTRFQQKDGRIHSPERAGAGTMVGRHLYDSKAEEARAVRLINMMTARLGPQACFGLSLANDHRPELAWRPVALNTKNYWHNESADSNPRPLYLLLNPSSLPQKHDQPQKMTLLQGPERIDFGWWDNQEVGRDYFVARHESGALYWVYRSITNHDWFLHGIFG